MKILVINAGSSSCKYQLIDMGDKTVLCSGLAERIGLEKGKLTHKIMPDSDKEQKIVRDEYFPTHVEAMELVISLLIDPKIGVIKDKKEINGIGHRVLHGGEEITQPVLVDKRVRQVIKDNFLLGPLHNPANLMGIEVCEKLFPGVPNVAVFDTEFGVAGLPPEAYIYALPYAMYTELHVRRYGFHGTSHKFIARKTAEFLKKPQNELRSITMHLGNGSSMTCVKDGKCYDTSMGLTPLEGLVMGTRCGSIDPAIVPFMEEKMKYTPAEADAVMNKQSGLFGICGMTDMRDVHAAAEKGDEKAGLAVKMLVRSIRKTLGAYVFLLDGNLDSIVFTAGIGENDAEMRAKICSDMEYLGLKVDAEACAKASRQEASFQAADSKVEAWVLPTNEELMIARDTLELTSK